MEEKILKILSNVLECEVDKGTSQANCDNWDSIKHLALVVELESEFGVMLEPEEIEGMKSVADVVKILNAKK